MESFQMLSNFSHYSPQGFIPQFTGLQGARWPQMTPGLFGQPGAYAGYVPFAQEPALAGMYPSPFLQTPFAPSPFAPSPFLQTPFAPSPFAPSPFLQTPFAPSPFAPSPFLQTPFASSPFAPNPLIGSFAGYAGAHHPAQQIVLLLGHLAPQLSAQPAVAQPLTVSMEDSSMAQEREERPGAAIKKTSEAGDDSMRKTTGTQSRSREPGGGALDASLPGRRPERYVIGTRTAPGGRPFAYPQFSM